MRGKRAKSLRAQAMQSITNPLDVGRTYRRDRRYGTVSLAPYCARAIYQQLKRAWRNRHARQG